MNYREEAESDAKDTIINFRDEIVEQLRDSGEASDDMANDYPSGDEYHHQSHVDKWYELSEAADVLDQLSYCEETDYGLWEGLEPRKAIACQAAFTYGNAVYGEWRDLISTINDLWDEENYSEIAEMLGLVESQVKPADAEVEETNE